MKSAYLHIGGDSIPVQVGDNSGNLLLECNDPDSFLQYVTDGRWVPCLSPGTFLRGVVFNEKETVFEILDQFGRMSDEIAKLGEDETRRMLMAIW